jgi:hypothetical protein
VAKKGARPKLTPQLLEIFVQTVRQTGRYSTAAMRCGITTSCAANWRTRGETEARGLYHEFFVETSRARGDFVRACATRHHQVVLGGLIPLPLEDKDGNPVKEHEPDCKTPARCRCPVIYAEKVVMPDVRGMEWELDRLDPQVSKEDEAALEQPGKTNAELMAEAAQFTDLFLGSVKILVELGVPLPQLAPPQIEPPAVETTAVTVPEVQP